MEYLEIALLVSANGLLGACLWGIRTAAQRRTANLDATVQHLAHVVSLLEAIALPSQRLGTQAQQPGDGRAALRERLALRSQRSH